MTDTTMTAIFCLAGYLAGSVPAGYIITKILKGVDIRTVGSGNPGATNVFRVAGAPAGAAVFAFDFLKGYLPVYFALNNLHVEPVSAILIGLFSIAGHMWTAFLGFKGGKGVATACGVFFAIMPMPTFYAFSAFLAVLYLTRYVSAGSVTAALLLPFIAWFAGEPRSFSAFATAIGLLVIIKHKNNVVRLLNGTEHKFGEKKK